MSNKIASALQALMRVIWDRPGRRARSPYVSPGSQPPQPWGTGPGGEKRYASEPLDNPPVHVLRRSMDLQRIYAELVRVSGERENRYKDYEDMILDPTVSGALELMVDDACQYNRERNATVWVRSDSRPIRKAIEELFDIIQVEERLFDWAFNTALYGDLFIQVEGQEGRGLLQIQDDWHPADLQRIDVNGSLLGWRTPRSFVETSQAMPGTIGDSDFWEPWQFVHFRIQSSQRRRREIERQRMAPMLRFEKNKYRLTTKYGVSMIDAVRRVYKQLQMVEQSLIVSRMTRALLKYIYKVQCGVANDPKSAAETVLAMKDLLTQQTGIRLGQDFEQQFSPLSGSEDIFLPLFGDRGDVTVEKLGGDVDVRAIVDVDYLRNKFFGGLKVPGAYLGFEEKLPGSLGESALLRLDIRYARTVKRLQRAIIQGLTRLAQIHLAYKKLDPNPKNFSIEMDVISTAEEEERKASLTSAITVGQSLAALNREMGVKLPVKKFAHLVYTEVLGLSGKFIDLIEEAEEIPMEGEVPPGGEVGGMPGGEMGMPGGEEEMPGEELSGEGALEVPPEGAGAEAPEEGPLPSPGVAAGTKPKKSKTIQELEEKGKLNISVAAKQQAIEAVTKQVRQSPDVQADTPRYSGGHLVRSKIIHWSKDKRFAQLLEGAVQLEQAERDAETERKEKARKAIKENCDQLVDVVEQVGAKGTG